MKNESTVFTGNSTNYDKRECPHCNHRFNTGGIDGEIFCVACGKKFDSAIQKAALSDSKSEQQQKDRAAASAINDSIRIGRRSSFGDYSIIEEVARGGMGVVYKAQHKTLKRIVALKILKSADNASEDDIKRFIQEAKAAAILKHPNIVPIHNFDIHRGMHFFTMDFIDGKPLDQLIESGPLPPYKACELMKSIAQSIAYAHSQGIIHRDIKPGNVIIDHDGRPMLTDFGLAVNLTSHDEEVRMTKSGAIMGTIPYISPEQAAGKVDAIGPLSDIYSLGALFYELTTGRPPFMGMTQFELLKQIINFYPPSPRKINHRISKDIDTIIMKCLSKEPERRYQSSEELADDCSAFLNGEIIKARPASLLYKAQRKILRKPAISIMVGSLILISIFTLAVLNYTQGTIQQLIESKAQQKQISKDKDVLGAMLKRDWRGEYSINFQNKTQPKISSKLSTATKDKIGWYDKKIASPTQDGLVIHSDKNSAAATAFGAPVSLPAIFHISLSINTPATNMGKVRIQYGLDKSFKQKDTTRTIELGVEGNPGAKIRRGNTSLFEDGSFSLKSDNRHTISVFRDTQNKVIVVQVDGNETIRIPISDETGSANDSFFGISADSGEFTLLSLQVSVLGMNQEMIKNSLRLADSLASESSDMEPARVLYSKILKERSERSILLKAYTGYVNTLSGRDSSIIADCSKLSESIRQNRSRYLELGEGEFLTGIALAHKKSAKASDYFSQSFSNAFRGALKDLHPDSTQLASFPAKANATGSASETPDIPAASNSSWQALSMITNKPGFYNINKQSNTALTYCLKQVYTLKEPLHAVIYINNDSDRLFINDTEFTDFLEDKERNRRYAITDLEEGANTFILLHQDDKQNQENTLQLRVRDHNLKYTNVYGLLSRVEDALLKTETTPDIAAKQFTTLQTDHTLEYLKQYYPEEIKSRGLAQRILGAADIILNKSDKYSNHAWILLEAAHTLSEKSDGSELALRYNNLAETLVKSGNLTQANELFIQASNLLPDWYIPLLNRAELLYRQEAHWLDGINAFDSALKLLPNSLELRLHIARFYLNPGSELSPDPSRRLKAIPERALAVAEEAVKLSNRNSPEALKLCSEALELMNNYTQALHYIQEAILLEDSPENKKIFDRLNKKINETTKEDNK